MVILLRIDSPANVVITGPDGRRIGVDPATGLPINDFGDDGVYSGPGTARFFALRNAAPGSYSFQSVATDAGSFAVHVYSADPAQPLGNHIVSRGVAAIGDINNHDFTLDPTGSIGFLGPGTAPGTTTNSSTQVTVSGISTGVGIYSGRIKETCCKNCARHGALCAALVQIASRQGCSGDFSPHLAYNGGIPL